MSDVLVLGGTYYLEVELDDPSIDLSTAPFIYVTMKQGIVQKTFTGDQIDLRSGNELVVFLSQADALAFKPGAVQLQVNWLVNEIRRGSTDGYLRRSSDIASFVFDKQLLRRTLPLASEVPK